MTDEQLEVVNENDEVIGIESRRIIHLEGLLHREIHIWFMTPEKEIIFQHRAKDKDMYPDKLDATVSGHVEPGMSYEETAIKEGLEETDITIDPLKLRLVRKMHHKSVDTVTGMINNTIRSQYVYLYEGNINNLVVERGKAIGFEAWKIDSLSNLSSEDAEKFIPQILSEGHLTLFNEGEKILGLN